MLLGTLRRAASAGCDKGTNMVSNPEARLRLENEALRRRYLATVATVTSEALSRWCSEGRIFAVEVEGEARAPAFQFAGGAPRPEIAQVLSALPRDQRNGWPAAFWFASPSGFLGCAPQQALDDPSRVGEVVRLAGQVGRAIG
ncbi:hypothetical protein [Tranquillimonas alkanivorans]|uniref:Antitoxin Xre/MbcA/ParS-like toxin-binding domain-containing protein n=1 Tax=Tranquillimonas alkanivorans TaxID=441119 RepID=A0A1I5TVB1_9RHOB|nr:hypothetical protein [Tranquillimonas alkanivorans]SFP86841.1 hypothetical protein SAMN04488047_11541 [Tranquillimonas alkanivorans]